MAQNGPVDLQSLRLAAAEWASEIPSAVLKARKVSMLREDALSLLRQLASMSLGPIIEIGPYIGGSTIAIAAGAAHDVITIEVGGANPDHPDLPTSDIITDLRANLEREGVASKVKVIEGRFSDESVLAEVAAALGGRRAGMLVVDTDPGSEFALAVYADFVLDGGWIVIDDYVSEIAANKSALLSAHVEKLIGDGALEVIGVYGWGTWFGRLGRMGADVMKALPSPLPCYHETGYCWLVYVGHADRDDRTGVSALTFLEADSPLRGHSLHTEIREVGLGTYSHWHEYLMFSTSDNSDPRTNARKYSYVVDGVFYNLNSPC